MIMPVIDFHVHILGAESLKPWVLTYLENYGQGSGAEKKVERCVQDLRMKGIKLYPTDQQFYPNDWTLYPLYATAQELKIPVMVHTGSYLGLFTRRERRGRFLRLLSAEY